jgi:hypothetical protein
MHTLLKHKMLQFLYYTAPTCFGLHGPFSGSTYQNLTKITLSLNTKTVACYVLIKCAFVGKERIYTYRNARKNNN